jgi:hypothetical protein
MGLLAAKYEEQGGACTWTESRSKRWVRVNPLAKAEKTLVKVQVAEAGSLIG